ncbi:ribonuclease H-like protein [Favolaschia claudopus]|uniref:ribonuclease H n=1 Tax=Favolaschia claudopus TaxID=2862362 RepID=A0AAW0DBS9_9AGAR
MPHYNDPNVSPRLFRFCPKFDADPVAARVDRCHNCDRFFGRCCHHADELCHYYPFVFVDGACPNNGTPYARSGIGCALGINENDQLSLPVDDKMDPGAPRTNQRAELLAAIHGLEMVVEKKLQYHAGIRAHLPSAEKEKVYVVAADSDYVVQGITDWVFQWKVNGWRTSKGVRPKNADLFKRLDDAVEGYERQGVTVQFLHVPREVNHVADALASRAAALPLHF